MAKDLLGRDESDSENGGVQLQDGTDFKINKDFARKFIHNKKREELRQCMYSTVVNILLGILIYWIEVEDKLTSKSLKRKHTDGTEISVGSSGDSTSDSEDEDDAGELATEALDSEIFATLSAIRSKDPRVYDKEATFYTQIDDVDSEQGDRATAKKEKPVFLRDYHRQNLLNGVKDDPEEAQEIPMTYNQEQEALKRSLVGEINAATANDSANSSSDDGMESVRHDSGFLVAKPRKREGIAQPQLDVENADKDPERFLSNFMAARAWVPSEKVQAQPFESDDEEEDRRAEEFEEAYNFRFEDPAKSNEKLVSHARDIAAKYSVRREEKKARKKQREAERERKEAARSDRVHEKARLRKLKIEEAEEKLRKIKKAAGLQGGDKLSPQDWATLLDEDWNDSKWEEEMQKRFGEEYYAQDDVSSDENACPSTKKRRKPKKPKWKDDIEINDLIPDLDEEGPTFELSDEAPEDQANPPNRINSHGTSKRDPKQNRPDKKKGARKERRIIEQLVDDRLELDVVLADQQRKAAGFRYRETSPLSFGLSARDILMAEDSRLNEYAGLKKLASFRDPNKKRKDQKHLGKKARLKQWRRETFGDENGPTFLAQIAPEANGEKAGVKEAGGVDADANVRMDATKKKRRRSKKSNPEQEAAV